jgi:hypothetical protein
LTGNSVAGIPVVGAAAWVLDGEFAPLPAAVPVAGEASQVQVDCTARAAVPEAAGLTVSHRFASPVGALGFQVRLQWGLPVAVRLQLSWRGPTNAQEHIEA